MAGIIFLAYNEGLRTKILKQTANFPCGPILLISSGKHLAINDISSSDKSNSADLPLKILE